MHWPHVSSEDPQLWNAGTPAARDDLVSSEDPQLWATGTSAARGDLVLVRVHAAAAGPQRSRSGVDFAGIDFPDLDFTGVVEAVGEDVRRFRPGDGVYGVGDVAFGEYLCAPQQEIARTPLSLDCDRAATVPLAGLTALQGLRDCAGLKSGERVLIVGAARPAGHLAVQLARHLGARVTAVCETPFVERVRALGANHVIVAALLDLTLPEAAYDAILHFGHVHEPEQLLQALTLEGRLVLGNDSAAGTRSHSSRRPAPGLPAPRLPAPRLPALDASSDAAYTQGGRQVRGPSAPNRTITVLRVRRRGTDLETLAALIDGGVLRP